MLLKAKAKMVEFELSSLRTETNYASTQEQERIKKEEKKAAYARKMIKFQRIKTECQVMKKQGITYRAQLLAKAKLAWEAAGLKQEGQAH